MKKLFVIACLAMCCTAAQPTSLPNSLGAQEYAVALSGGCLHEEKLLDIARDKSLPYAQRVLGMSAAICNQWSGPCRLQEFAAWVRDKRLASDLTVEEEVPYAEVGVQAFLHLPKGFKKLLIKLRSDADPNQFDFVAMAVDQSMSAVDVEKFFRGNAAVGAGEGPIIYGIRATIFPPRWDTPEGN